MDAEHNHDRPYTALGHNTSCEVAMTHLNQAPGFFDWEG